MTEAIAFKDYLHKGDWRSRVGTEPVAGSLMGLECLLSELLVAAILDCVHLKSVGVGVDEVVLGEQVGDRVEGGNDAQSHHQHDLGVGNL